MEDASPQQAAAAAEKRARGSSPAPPPRGASAHRDGASPAAPAAKRGRPGGAAAAEAAAAGGRGDGDGWYWHCGDRLLAYQYLKGEASDKIAAFDFDGTLAKTALYDKGADAWSVLYPGRCEEALRGLHTAGYRIVVMTNQGDIGRATKTFDKTVAEKKGRLRGFAQKVGVPMLILVSTRMGKVQDDAFRKPGKGMWEWVEEHNGDVAVDRVESLYVGDAAGRPMGDGRKKDHSDTDMAFAQALDVPFFTETDFFGGGKLQKQLAGSGKCGAKYEELIAGCEEGA